MKNKTVRDLTHIAIVAALYVVLTIVPPFNLISYGPYQFRIAEMFNLLGFYNRKYIIAVTLGCVIANFFSFNMIDVVVGSLSTLVFVGSGVYFFDRFKNQDILGGLFDKAHVYFAFYFSFFMVTIAAELTLVAQAPFWATWVTVALGELASLLVGAVLIKKLAKVIDLFLKLTSVEAFFSAFMLKCSYGKTNERAG